MTTPCTADTTAITADSTSVTADLVCLSVAEQTFQLGAERGQGHTGMSDQEIEDYAPGAPVSHLRARGIGGQEDTAGDFQTYPKTFMSVDELTAAGLPTQPVLAPLTAVAFNTSTMKWGIWVEGGANGMDAIRGFIFPLPVYLKQSAEVHGVVAMSGAIHYDDIANEKTAAFITALRTATNEKNFVIQGLTDVR